MRMLPRLPLALALILTATPVPAQTAGSQSPDRIGERTVELLQRYLQLETVNPPGNEGLAVEFLADVLDAEGIPYEVIEGAPGRPSLIARLDSDDSRGGGVVLLNHTDVVPADARFWSQPPFAGRIVDGRILGRGAADMKGYGAVQLMTMVALKRSGVPLGRDIVFMATAGEETGGQEGAGTIAEERPDLLAGVDFVLTEGGGPTSVGGRTAHFIEVTQKTPLWLRLHATGVAGHGSQAIRESAANRLVRALDRLRTYRPPIRLVPPVADMIRASAELVSDPGQVQAMYEVEENISDPGFLLGLDQQFGNLLRSTIAITVLSGSSKTNVISPTAVAELDCRLLPGTNADLFLATLRDVIDDPDIEIEILLRFEASASEPGTPLWRAIEEVARTEDPDAVLVPAVLAGFTDAHYFREKGITAYGWSPIRMGADHGPAHGVDEGVSVEAIRRAPGILYDVLVTLAGTAGSS